MTIWNLQSWQRMRFGFFTDKEELPADQGNLIWRAAGRMKELYQISEGVSVKLTSGFRLRLA